ncbi:hypothetical protein [Mesorhizobium sp. Pch-S]|uniref:hypothetical protein n=1 Tax=Mesorhizobium sp. Pch-S TaxID=2082387 RepID=UPI001012B95C|nr:hypothetical protein [Mesorhizobium sp. Pch-S]QAZ46763.1 hypothetical protein C1M53_31410 [Mesorhizobium sp. Pch-S]
MILRNATEMSADEMAPYWADIRTCLAIYCKRFSGEETVENILSECLEGKRTLWLCLDGDEVVLTPITEIVTINATGKKQLILAEVGGSRLKECLPLLDDIERWAKEVHGVEEAQLVGRKGWGRLLPELGYAEKARIYRKAL